MQKDKQRAAGQHADKPTPAGHAAASRQPAAPGRTRRALTLALAIACGLAAAWLMPDAPAQRGRADLPAGYLASRLASLEVFPGEQPIIAGYVAMPDLPDQPDLPGINPPALPPVFGEPCPIALEQLCYQVTYTGSGSQPSWQGQCELSCPEAAEQLLLMLRDDGWTLEEHGFMDLFGDAWSCIVSRNDQSEVLIVTVMPKSKYGPSGPDNPMVVRLAYLTAESLVEP